MTNTSGAFILLFLLPLSLTALEFTGSEFFLRQDAIVQNNVKLLANVVKNISAIKYPDLVDVQKVWVFTFDGIMSNIVTTGVTLETKDMTYTLANNIFTMTFPKGLKIDFKFELDISLSDAHLISGDGTGSVIAQNVVITQEYLAATPRSKVNLTLTPTNLVFSGGLLALLLSDSISKVIDAGVRGNITTNITAAIGNSIKYNLDEKFLESVKQVKMLDSTAAVVTKHYFNAASTITFGGQPGLVLFQDAAVYVDGQVDCRGVIRTASPYYPPVDGNFRWILCYSEELFIAGITAGAVCGNRRSTVDLVEWGIRGRAKELYEILPSLADIYAPDDTFTVARDIVPEIKYGATFKNEMKKTYVFTMTKDSKAVLKITTTFGFNTDMSLMANKGFSSFYRSVKVLEVTFDQSVDPIGKATALKFMQIELKKFNNMPLFDTGIYVFIPVLDGEIDAPITTFVQSSSADPVILNYCFGGV